MQAPDRPGPRGGSAPPGACARSMSGSLTVRPYLSDWEPVTVRRGRPAIGVLLALVATACNQDMTVYARMGDRPPNPDAAAPPSSQVQLVAAGITIDRFRIVLHDIRLQTASTKAGEP